jgi:hypothetical protein
MLRSHAQWAPLEMFPYSANAGHAGKNHNGQTHKADLATNVENLRCSTELSPFGDHRFPSFPKDLKLVPTVCTPFLINLDRPDSE